MADGTVDVLKARLRQRLSADADGRIAFGARANAIKGVMPYRKRSSIAAISTVAQPTIGDLRAGEDRDVRAGEDRGVHAGVRAGPRRREPAWATSAQSNRLRIICRPAAASEKRRPPIAPPSTRVIGAVHEGRLVAGQVDRGVDDVVRAAGARYRLQLLRARP